MSIKHPNAFVRRHKLVPKSNKKHTVVQKSVLEKQAQAKLNMHQLTEVTL